MVEIYVGSGIIALVFFIFQMVVLATAIDIGNPAIDRETTGETYTFIDLGNPANATGKITSVEIWCETNLVNCEVATFFNVAGNNYSTRATQAIGGVASGARRTFEVDLSVATGDFIGMYFTSGAIELSPSGGVNLFYKDGDFIPCTDETFTVWGSNYRMSLYGTGIAIEVAKKNVIFMGSNF